MPLPMVHLAVAVRMRELQGLALTPAFLLGSISPDAIHMRPATGPDDKLRVHLRDAPDADHLRVRTLLLRHWAERSSAADFAEGYAAHLLTDRLWIDTVFASFRASIPADLTRQEYRALYYRDTDQIDLELHHRMPWRPQVWRRLAAAEARDFFPLLTAEEIERWQQRTLDWYDKLKGEPGIKPLYITLAAVQAFIERAAETTVRQFANWRSEPGPRPCVGPASRSGEGD